MKSERAVKLECFFDCSSPWTYLGFHNIQRVAERLGLPIIWKPIVVGGVFNKVNTPVYANRDNPPVPRKAEYGRKDMLDWARFAGLTINFPPACGHPVNAVKCMRACILLQPLGKLVPFATAAFEALWTAGLDLSDEAVLVQICRRAGVEPDHVMRGIGTAGCKQALWDNTNELMDRNGFGSPTFFVDDSDMYFGNDRVMLVEAAIRWRQQAAADQLAVDNP